MHDMCCEKDPTHSKATYSFVLTLQILNVLD